MPWKGAVFGGCIGGLIGGALGGLIGAVLGYTFEQSMSSGRDPRQPQAEGDAHQRELVFYTGVAAMLAKLAKADGAVTRAEIAAVEDAFRRLRFDGQTRAYAVQVFRRAKDDVHTIYEYAVDFRRAVASEEVRTLFYGLLWDLACSDGSVGAAEMEILYRITGPLGISERWFYMFRAERVRQGAHRERDGSMTMPANEALADAYATLGVAETASDEEVRRAYREKAKKCHPDALRAQGLPDEMVARATDMMAKVNAAWEAVRSGRNMR